MEDIVKVKVSMDASLSKGVCNDSLMDKQSKEKQRIIEELLKLDRTVEDELMELDNDDDDGVDVTRNINQQSSSINNYAPNWISLNPESCYFVVESHPQSFVTNTLDLMGNHVDHNQNTNGIIEERLGKGGSLIEATDRDGLDNSIRNRHTASSDRVQHVVGACCESDDHTTNKRQTIKDCVSVDVVGQGLTKAQGQVKIAQKTGRIAPAREFYNDSFESVDVIEAIHIQPEQEVVDVTVCRKSLRTLASEAPRHSVTTDDEFVLESNSGLVEKPSISKMCRGRSHVNIKQVLIQALRLFVSTFHSIL